MLKRTLIGLGLLSLVAAAGLAACQRLEWVYVPDAVRTGVHVRFSVETPSKADILFVIDNSDSMAPKQQALRDSLGSLLTSLAPNDTSYRIGIVSTDDVGWTVDCSGNDYTLPPAWLPTALDRCDKPICAAAPPYADPTCVSIRRPHDGVFGRLLAAFSPAWFDPGKYGDVLTTPDQMSAFSLVVPTAVDAGPVDGSGNPTSVSGAQGVPWVINRDIVRADACNACKSVLNQTTTPCNCTTYDKKSACYTGCIDPVSIATVRAFFSSTVEGLGVNGSGWEQGLRSGLLAVGINAELALDDTLTALKRAVDWGGSTMAAGGPNTYTSLGSTGQPSQGSRWLRDEAILGVMFVSDEQDCSMPAAALSSIRSLEGPLSQPIGSGCYQSRGQAILTPTDRVAALYELRKESNSRVAMGFIGGAEPVGPVGSPFLQATARDCRTDTAANPEVPNYNCAGLTNGPDGWLQYTQNIGDPTGTCDALAGSRYLEVGDKFSRRTYDSICQPNFGVSLSEFAKRLISACFDLDLSMQPAGGDPANIEVIRTAKADQGSSAVPTKLAYLTDCTLAGPGWCYYQPVVGTDSTQNPQVCLVGFDRLIGDVYDIFVLTTDQFDPSH